MKVKKCLLAFVVLLMFSISLAIVNLPVQAQFPGSYVKVYVNQPLGYIPGVPESETVSVDIIIEVSGIPDNSPEGIRGWGMDVSVNPDVLEPVTVKGDTWGYFLFEFCPDPWDWYDPLYPGTIDPTTGYWDEISEILPPDACSGGGAGERYSGLKLVTLIFRSKSEAAYSLIDLIHVDYMTPDGVWHPVDEAIDGHYNLPPVPEFPLGLTLMMVLAAAIPIVYLWRNRITPHHRTTHSHFSNS